MLPASNIIIADMFGFRYMGGASLLPGACSSCCCRNGNHRNKVGPQSGQCFPNVLVLWYTEKPSLYDTLGKMDSPPPPRAHPAAERFGISLPFILVEIHRLESYSGGW